MRLLHSANDCIRADMIAWVQYPNGLHRECFVYPQYLKKDNRWFKIDPEAFPNNGSFLAFVTGSSDTQQIYERYASLVVARVNISNFDDNAKYEPSRDISSKYRVAINPEFHRGNSDLEFDVFSDTVYSSELIQVVSADEVQFGRVSPDSSLLEIGETADEPVCQNILIRTTENGCEAYYGPFEYTFKDAGALGIRGLASFDYRIGKFGTDLNSHFMTITNKDGHEEAAFIDDQSFRSLFKKESLELIDWLPSADLVEEVCRAISSAADFKALGKSQIRKIKAAVRACSEAAGGLNLDSIRRDRMVNIVLRMEDILSLDDTVLQSIAERIDDDRLAHLVADEQLLPGLQARLMENAGIQEKFAEEEKKLKQTLMEIEEEVQTQAKKLEQAEKEAQEAIKKANEAKKASEKIQEQILNKRRAELIELDSAIEKSQAELEAAQEERDQMIYQRKQAQAAFNKVFDGINDEVAASTKILESEVLRKIIAKVSESELLSESDSIRFEPKTAALLANNKSSHEILEELYQTIGDEFGRECTSNDVANYMICIIQGYITTFAGQPGTGKTSLCNILGEALGLRNADFGERFVEISVENGWTSYKDYVGYYNPLSKRYEKANALIYDALRALANEQDEHVDYPPFFVLLDEANLSPVEHYWSPFLRACDTFNTAGTMLSLGGSETWSLPKHLRFLATVNFDHTTEALSPRFLDRSWVITLGPSQIDMDDLGECGKKKHPTFHPYSYSALAEAFGPNKETTITAPVRGLYERILKTCREHSFTISPRSQSMMLRYVSTAESLMRTDSRDSQFAPLDYAVAQKVLPMLHGPEETIGNFIRALESECSQMQITRNHLKRMIAQGEDSGFYQFFA